MANKGMPVLKPTVTNAYELLDQICEIIEEEPRRYNQEDWLYIREAMAERYSACPEDLEAIFDRVAQSGEPECGTVGCVAGWTLALIYGIKADEILDSSWTARLKLGLTAYQGGQLFSGSACDHTTPGTREHAEAGVAHIRQFMANYEDQLKAKEVVRAY